MPTVFMLLLVVLPLVELYLLIKLGSIVGALPTIIFLLLKAIVGGWLVQRQGLTALQRMAEAMNEGRPPVTAMLDSIGLLAAGTLLFIPGLLSSAVGALLLIPPVRRSLLKFVLTGSRLRVWTVSRQTSSRDSRSGFGQSADSGGPIIDGEFERLDETGRARDGIHPRPNDRRSPWAR